MASSARRRTMVPIESRLSNSHDPVIGDISESIRVETGGLWTASRDDYRRDYE